MAFTHAEFFAAGGNIFGGSSPSSGSSTGGAFSSGLGQSISQSGFGSPATFQSKPGMLMLFVTFSCPQEVWQSKD
jgi:hypothetical protein